VLDVDTSAASPQNITHAEYTAASTNLYHTTKARLLPPLWPANDKIARKSSRDAGAHLARAATVVEDGDHGGAAREVVERGRSSDGLSGLGAEERSSHGSGGTSLHDLWEKKMCERVTMINLVSCARYGGY
jgi:hypothetical protein